MPPLPTLCVGYFRKARATKTFTRKLAVFLLLTVSLSSAYPLPSVALFNSLCVTALRTIQVGHLVQRCCSTGPPLLTRNRQLAGVNQFPSFQRSPRPHVSPHSIRCNSQVLGSFVYRSKLPTGDALVRRNKRKRPLVSSTPVAPALSSTFTLNCTGGWSQVSKPII